MITSKLLLFVISVPLMGHMLFDPAGKTNPSLNKLFFLTGIKEGDLHSIVDQTQKEYLRKPGTERWDIDEAAHENHEEIRKLFEELEYIQEIKPTKKEYKYAVLFGALGSRVRTRLDYLIDILKSDVKCEKIIVLGSERPAHKDFESAEKLSEFFGRTVSADEKHTEYTIMKEMVESSELKKMGLPIAIYSAPNHADGTRANTADTVELWMSSNPEAGNVLCISNQPYIWYQHEVAKSLLPETFEIESCGPKMVDSTTDGILLDTLAREIYQYNKQISSKKQ